jgi:hypothetical protein
VFVSHTSSPTPAADGPPAFISDTRAGLGSRLSPSMSGPPGLGSRLAPSIDDSEPPQLGSRLSPSVSGPPGLASLRMPPSTGCRCLVP